MADRWRVHLLSMLLLTGVHLSSSVPMSPKTFLNETGLSVTGWIATDDDSVWGPEEVKRAVLCWTFPYQV